MRRSWRSHNSTDEDWTAAGARPTHGGSRPTRPVREMKEVVHTAPRVLSVNVGAIREIEWRGEQVRTAIWKHPVAGRITLRGVNFDGDDQADRSVHGGVDKAVYAYAREDYDFWRDREGMETSSGLFG